MKVKKTYRLEQETIEELEKLCSDSGKSATEVIDHVVDAHVPCAAFDVGEVGWTHPDQRGEAALG